MSWKNPVNVYPSDRREAWQRALNPKKWDEKLLDQLCKDERPGVALYELVNYVGNQYRAAHENEWLKGQRYGEVCGARLHPRIVAIRNKLGWRAGEADIGVLRWLRRSTKVCLVIGAGVTVDAGGPSWSELVKALIEIGLGKEHEIARILPDPDSILGDRRFIKEIVPVPPLEPAKRGELEEIRAHILQHGTASETERLMRGARICYELFGQQLLKHITDIVYDSAPDPGPIHRAIADVAAKPRQYAPGETYPAWASIINYNFDGLLFDALLDNRVPQEIVVMEKGKQVTYRHPDQDYSWWQRTYHIHGLTPSFQMNITDMNFVFSTTQYEETYKKANPGIVKKIRDGLVVRPPLVALYIGCSFSDEYMNHLLKDAWKEYFGRMHYALLRWPENRDGRDPSPEEIEKHSMKYLNMGVQPIWFDDFGEIPDIIRSLA